MNVLHGFHPSFDALSSFVDLSDVDAARSRTGRHVARCEPCGVTVGEIRALGDAARAAEVAGPPADLWTRIERAQADGEPATRAPRETPAPESGDYKSAPALRPTRHLPSPMRRGLRGAGALLLAAGLILAVLLVPTRRGERLQAGGSAGTWRFTPARPAPGAAVSVVYTPAADESLPRTMILVGGFARPRADVSGRAFTGINGLQDSVATLERRADGAYAGRFLLPADFSAMVARLAHPDGRRVSRIMSSDGPVSRGREATALLVGGDARGAPSLESLTAALYLWNGSGAPGYRVADTLVRYFPDEPVGYAYLRAPESRRLLDGLLAWFTSGERKYLALDRRLMAEPTVSVERATAMIAFAHRIDEPAELRKWTMRLAREHADDPRALYLYASMLRGMFSRANTVDSVRRDLPLADTLWERNGHRGASEEIIRAAATAGDGAAYRRWTLRAMQEGVVDWRGDRMSVSPDALYDPDIRRAATPLLRAGLARSCALPPGKVSLWDDNQSWTERCTAGRAENLQGLSRVARLDGEPARALALADSAIALMASTGNCWQGGSHVRRGEALLALGDREGAARDLAWGASWGNWQARAFQDSVGQLLRPAVDSARWDALMRSVSAERAVCVARADRRRAERTARRRAEEQADQGRRRE